MTKVKFLFISGQFNTGVVVQTQQDSALSQLTRPDFVPVLESANINSYQFSWGCTFVIDVANYATYGNFSSITTIAGGWIVFDSNPQQYYMIRDVVSYRNGTTQVVTFTYAGQDNSPIIG